MHALKSIGIGFLILFPFGFSDNVTGQPFKLGKIGAQDFITGEYEKDPDAGAVILYDYGYTSLELDSRGRRGFIYVYRRQMRLQVLDERGLTWANHSIPLFGKNSFRETMTNFSGFVHQLENGKIQTLEVKSREGIIEHMVDGYKNIKFSFPDVRPGSILEIGYTIRSNYLYNLQPWQFQYSIPVEHSEYSLMVPDFFDYRFYVQGYEPFYTFETKKVSPGRLSFMTRGTRYHWVMKDVPALSEEPYTNSISNYLSRIRFELASMFLPGQTYKPLIRHWDDVDERFHEDRSIEDFLIGTRQLRDDMQALNQAAGSEMEKITKALQYTQDNIRWNQRNGIAVSNSPRKIVRQGEGNSAEVNLMLIAALRQLGFQAHPLISSTRSNGILVPGFPTLSGFNYLVAHAQLEDGSVLLLDATDIHCPPGMLPARALNGQGRLMEEGKERWIDLKPKYPSSEKKKYHFSLDAKGQITASATLISHDYAAYNLRMKLDSLPDLDKYKEQWQSQTPGMQITRLQIENQEDILHPVTENITFSLSDAVSHTGELIFFKPLLFESMQVNPFRLENRNFPIDFTFPLREEIIMVYDLPEGYEVDFMPQDMSIGFQNQMVFDFSTRLNDQNQLEVRKVFEAPDHIIEAPDYSELKAFFNKMVEKQNEQVTLKKSF